MSIENLYRESLLAGHAARVYELADSTNTRLKAWAEEGAPILPSAPRWVVHAHLVGPLW